MAIGRAPDMSWEVGPIEYKGAAMPVTCPKGQWLAEYFANVDVSGSPVFSQCEPAINHNWGNGGPGNGVPAENFSARWTGVFGFPGGDVEFTITVDDGARLWIDGVLIIDTWIEQSPMTYKATRNLSAGDHAIRLEFFEAGWDAQIQLSWKTLTAPPPPTSDVYVKLKAGTQLNNVKVTKRKTNISHDVLITVNKDTTVKWEIV